MLIDFTVGASINIQEALAFAKNYKFEYVFSHGAGSKRHAKAGIKEIRLNVDVKRLLKYPTMPVCQLNVDIDVSKFTHDNDVTDLKEIKSNLDSIIKPSGIKDISWNVIHCKFKKVIQTEYVDQYMDLIKKIHKPQGRGNSLVLKEGETFRSASKVVFSNGTRELSIDKNSDVIILYLSLSNRKINESAKKKKYGIVSKALNQMDAKTFENAELQLWNEYLSKIFGEGDYYSQIEAEKILKEKCKSISTRHKLIAVLKGVSVYKGIDDFLAHVKDKERKYDFMEEIQSKSSANKYLRDLNKVYGINPVVISRRDAAALNISSLPSLVSLAGVMDYKPQKTKKVRINPKDAEYAPFWKNSN